MKKLNMLLAASVVLVLVGCGGKSNDYTPAADASGETMFSMACTQCHTPISQDVVMVISESMASKEAIIAKFQSGSMRMPAFENINGEAADRLAEYVLSHSQTQ